MPAMIVSLTTEDAEAILAYDKGGLGDKLSITLPRPHERLPFMTIPHQMCVKIMRQHTFGRPGNPSRLPNFYNVFHLRVQHPPTVITRLQDYHGHLCLPFGWV